MNACKCGWKLPKVWRVVVRLPSLPENPEDEEDDLWGVPLYLVLTCPECGLELEHEGQQDEVH